MKNKDFLTQIGVTKPETIQKCLAAMERYGDNKWWEPDVDPRKYAYYQIREPLLLGTFDHFHESIELLLGRPVYTHEFGISHDALVQEAERAWTYSVGVTSEIERWERVAQSLESLENWAKRNGKRVVNIQLPRNEE